MIKAFTLTMDEITSLLKEAYESGWYGSLELRDSVVENLLLRASDKLLQTQQTNVSNVTDGIVSPNFSYQASSFSSQMYLPFSEQEDFSSSQSTINTQPWNHMG